MKVTVHRVVNKYVLCAIVHNTNALLRFRFERPLNVDKIEPGREITVLECEFSTLTHLINCRHVLETDVMCAQTVSRPLLA